MKRRPRDAGGLAEDAGAPVAGRQLEERSAGAVARGRAHLWIVRGLGNASLLLALVADVDSFTDSMNAAARQLRSHRNSVWRWRAELLHQQLVAEDGEGLRTTELARDRLACSDPLPRQLLWPSAPPATPACLRVAALLYGEVIGWRADRPGVRSDRERAKLADVDRALITSARQLLEGAGLVRFERVVKGGGRGRLLLWRGKAVLDERGVPVGSHGAGPRGRRAAARSAESAPGAAAEPAPETSHCEGPNAPESSQVAGGTAPEASHSGDSAGAAGAKRESAPETRQPAAATAPRTSQRAPRLHQKPAGRAHQKPAAPCSPQRDHSHASRAREDGSQSERTDGCLAAAAPALATIDPRAGIAVLAAAKAAPARRRGRADAEQAAQAALADLRRLAEQPGATMQWLSGVVAARGAAGAIELLLQRLGVWNLSHAKRRRLAGETALRLQPEDVLRVAADCALVPADDLPAMLRSRLEAARNCPAAAVSKSRSSWPIGRLLEAVAATVDAPLGNAPGANGGVARQPHLAGHATAPAIGSGTVARPAGASMPPGSSQGSAAPGIDCELRRRLVSRLFGDRQPVSRVATEFDLAEQIVEQVRLEEEQERAMRSAKVAPLEHLPPARRQPPFLQRGAS